MTQPIPIKHVEAGQDSDALQKVARDVAKILTPNEEISTSQCRAPPPSRSGKTP